jgi:transcriptional regulator with XRE-family HTH domain
VEEARARKRVLARQLEQMMKDQCLTKAKLARRMRTSRSALDRLLDPTNASVTLYTMTAAAHGLGTTLDVNLHRRSAETVRAQTDPALRWELLRQAVETFLTGNLGSGKAILSNYIKATLGFEKLAQATKKPPKSLMRMFSPRGNPDAGDLFEILSYLQSKEGIHFDVRAQG